MAAVSKIDELAVNTIRMLSADAVQQANSGHPGMPMGMADVAYVLWTRFLKYNPRDPKWPNRDRFVLSAGHGSMLLYSMLHLGGYDVSLDDIKNFRQLGSITPGHPEAGLTPGVECTTGPLGQGFANGVGMAIASQVAAARFNSGERKLIDHYVYAIVSDGDLMEGIGSEAASIAGHLGLGNLIYLYDNNHITIEGDTGLAFSEDVAKRFDAYGWQTIEVDAHNHEQIAQAIEMGQADTLRPTLILCRSHIGFGSPNKQDTSSVHGEPLGNEELEATKKNLGWPSEPRFLVPDEVRELFAKRAEALLPAYEAWQATFAAFRANDAELAAVWDAMWNRTVPEDLYPKLLEAVGDKEDATRNHGGAVIQVVSQYVPALLGGSADLAPSTKTLIKGSGDIARLQFDQKNLRFGVREHAMGGICNGMALYGCILPYGSTFLVFSDYMRPSIRVAAISKLPNVLVFTHDSIFVGEDGPTHEPIEHVASFRAMPNVTVIRPADGPETAAAWMIALERTTGPTLLCLTRQKLPTISAGLDPMDLKRGAYVALDCEGDPTLVIIGTGSEAHLAVAAATELQSRGVAARAVSMPSWEVFEEQSEEYRSSVLPDGTRRVAIEAGSPMGWEKYVGRCGLIIAMDRYGESAPYQALADHFGFTPEKVIAAIDAWL
ncbi:MAG: transketolase, partial [Armatimonadetes bacterium]|nr:transketolase [Armatimonadota bacterium]